MNDFNDINKLLRIILLMRIILFSRSTSEEKIYTREDFVNDEDE